MQEVCLEMDAEKGLARLLWVVVRTKPCKERVAVINLAHRGVEAYCPLMKLPPWHRRAPRGPIPLFPSYLFAFCRPEEQLHRMRYCPGIQAPVVFAGVLATVSDDVVGALKCKESGRGFLLPKDVDRGFAPGRPVRVHSGPLSGLQGVFVEYVNGRDRARILVEFLRRRTSLETETIRLTKIR